MVMSILRNPRPRVVVARCLLASAQLRDFKAQARQALSVAANGSFAPEVIELLHVLVGALDVVLLLLEDNANIPVRIGVRRVERDALAVKSLGGVKVLALLLQRSEGAMCHRVRPVERDRRLKLFCSTVVVPLVSQEISKVQVSICTFRVYLDGSAISTLGLVVLSALFQNDAEVVVGIGGRVVDFDREL